MTIHKWGLIQLNMIMYVHSPGSMPPHPATAQGLSGGTGGEEQAADMLYSIYIITSYIIICTYIYIYIYTCCIYIYSMRTYYKKSNPL